MLLSAERSDMQVLLPTLAGKTYRVDYATNLVSPVQRTVLRPSVAGTGGSVTVVDTNAAGLPKRFYRAVRLGSP